MASTPKDVLHRWLQFVNNGDLEGVTALYDSSAVLLPTFSNKILKTPEGICDYFEKVSQRPELNVKLHERTLISQDLGNGVHSIGGIYCWRFEVDGDLLSFEARFTYVVDVNRDAPILHHHSSQVPRGL